MGLRGDAGGDANGDVNGGVFAGDFGGGAASVFVSFFGDLGGGAMFSVEEMFSNFAARTLVLGDLLVDTGGGVESTEFSRAIISNLAASSLAEGVLILAGGCRLFVGVGTSFWNSRPVVSRPRCGCVRWSRHTKSAVLVRCASGVASAVHDTALLETEVNPEAETEEKQTGKSR